LEEPQRALIEQHQATVPVDLIGLARALGLEVLASTLGPGISGELRRKADGSFQIRVNRHDAKKRQRFTVAHEIAHFLLHRDEVGDGIEDDVLYRSRLSNPIEAQANRLASDILMPEQQVRNMFHRTSGVTLEERLSRVSDEFGVSDAALKIRLGLQ
jgi:post-segregation antitoxin (ccd killing protein)